MDKDYNKASFTRRVAHQLLPHDVMLQLDYWRYGKRDHAGALDPNRMWSMACMLEKKCIFIHVPKCGGISMSRLLYGSNGPGHCSVTSVKEAIGPLKYHSLFSFAFVRNPYSRLVSAFTFLMGGGFNHAESEWVRQNLSGIESFQEFVLEWLTPQTMQVRKHFRLQTSFVCESHRPSRPGVNFVGKIESVERDWRYIASKTGADFVLPRHNETNRSCDWRALYTPEVARRVRELYAHDFSVFNYDTALPSAE